MNQETPTNENFADGLALYAAENGGDIQRYIVAPAMLEMMGTVKDQSVLDLYCGAGYLSRRLAGLGADVTAVDSSERLIGIAREINEREGYSINYAVAQPTDLSVIEDSMFDDIVCNMGLMFCRDLTGTIAELARLVKLGGRFIFSVIHPSFYMADACWIKDNDGKYLYKTVDNYFTEGWWTSDMVGAGRVRAKTKHRTIARYINALGSRGFTVRKILEPRPSPEVLTLKPHLEIFDRLPVAMIIEGVFPYL